MTGRCLFRHDRVNGRQTLACAGARAGTGSDPWSNGEATARSTPYAHAGNAAPIRTVQQLSPVL